MGATERLERYARLIVEVGLNLQPGQRLAVGCLVDHAPVARAVAAQAYAAGGYYVDVLYGDRQLRRSQVELGDEAGLGWSPPWFVQRLDDLGADAGALLSLTGDPTGDLMAGLDGGRIARSRMRGISEASLRLTGGACNWTVVGAPNAGWATTVFGEPDLERLWAAVAACMRLDEPDPVEAWRAHLSDLDERAGRLNDLALDELHFLGPGTDLRIGLLPGSRWTSSHAEAHGIVHVPNMPTEEVFTTPDARRVSGTVRSTYPLPLEGAIVRGLRVRFEHGRAVEVTAEQGKELIRTHIASDAGASRLGEVALVDRSSRVARTGLVFSNVLFDENAASHIAFGDAIVRAVEGASALGREERHARGVNASSLHTDFMIGSDEVSVDGVTRTGAVVPILRDGSFVVR